MKYISIILCLAILAVWLFHGAREFWSAKGQNGLQRVLTLFASTFFVVGALGFFGSALFAMGAFDWMPHSFEWPMGYATGVVATKDGCWVVPHTPTGRVQIYDSNWKFLRGWNVDAGAGTFKLFVTDTNRIHVVTARLHRHYVYDIDGILISSESYPATGGGYSSFPEEGKSCFVPTPFWLLVFTSPFYAWAVAIAGFGCYFARDKVSKVKNPKATEPS